MAAKPKVYLGLSGGVDSSVAAAVLLEQGYDVTPVFIKCWENDAFGECPWKEDQEAAYESAKALGIADTFRSWNFVPEFFETVAQPFIDGTQKGLTGVPDADCNRTIKFGAFFNRAIYEGADYVATGHYARIRKLGNRYQLLRPKCEYEHDQTYFLWQVPQKNLSRVLFPIGDFESKEAVRVVARERGLPSADRPSTRGICFVGKTGLHTFLREFVPENPGPILTTVGREVGTHRGLQFYTIGQRKGLGASDAFGPYYVYGKDFERNALLVASPAESAQLLQKDSVIAGDVRWMGDIPELPKQIQAKIRHPQEPRACTVSEGNHPDELVVRFQDKQYAPAPGQAVVLYDGDTVLGGGTIKK